MCLSLLHTHTCIRAHTHAHKVVSMVKNPEWINTVSYIPLLRYSILSPLLSEYVPDGVGISPTTIHHVYRMNLLPKQQQQQQQMQHQTQQQSSSSAPLAQQQGSVSTQQPTDNDSKPTQNGKITFSVAHTFLATS